MPRSRVRTIAAGALSVLAAACGGGGGGGDGGSGSTPTRITVNGQCVTLGGTPTPFMRVIVAGHDPVLADIDGRFTVDDVETPYDVATVGAGDEPAVVVTLGLSRPDPRVVSTVEDDPFSASISGTVSGGAGFPEPAAHQTEFSVVTSPTNGGTGGTANTTTGAYSTSPSWFGLPSSVAHFTFLQYQTVGGLVSTFTGAATPSLAVADGDTPVLNVALLPVTTATVSGTYTLPAGYTFSSMELDVEGPDFSLLNLPGDGVDDGSFSFASPVLAGRTSLLQVGATPPLGGQSIAVRRGLVGTVSGISITVPEAATLLFPLDGAFDVDLETEFFASPTPRGVLLWQFRPDFLSPGPSYIVITTDLVTRIPDLSEFGIQLQAATEYSASVVGLGVFDGMDDFAGPDGPLPSPDMYLTSSDSITVTTAP